MARVLTNFTGFQYAIEASAGTLPGSPVWNAIEPNTVTPFGNTISTVARQTISANRQDQEGTVTDLDSAIGFEADLTLSHFTDFIEGYCFASAVGPVGGDIQPTAVTGGVTDEYTHATLSVAIPAGRLVYARGFTNPGNDGLKVVDTGGSTTTTPVTTDLVDETPGATDNVQLQVAGVEGATGDLQINAAGNLTSAILDFTTLGLTPGQFIYLPTNANGGFATAANTGFAQVTVIAANEITLARRQNTFVTDNGAGVQIRVFFGQFIRNVAVTESNFIERYFQFEAAWKDLIDPGPVDGYEYSTGNLCNEATFNINGQDKATVAFGFVGLVTEEVTATRKTNAAAGFSPNQVAAYNTSSDVARLRVALVDETGITTDFNQLSFTINNNVSPEKVIGTLGARFLNTGNFQVTIDGTVIFTSAAVINAIRNNTTVSFDFSIQNTDGAIYVDIPSMKLGGGDRDLPQNESVRVQMTGSAFQDAAFGYSAGFSLFPHIPEAT